MKMVQKRQYKWTNFDLWEMAVQMDKWDLLGLCFVPLKWGCSCFEIAIWIPDKFVSGGNQYYQIGMPSHKGKYEIQK